MFDAGGDPIADSYVIADQVEWKPLPPVPKPGELQIQWRAPWDHQPTPATRAQAEAELNAEVAAR